MTPESKTTEAARREQPDTAGKLRTRAPDGSATRHPFVRREPWTADARDCGSGPRCRLATSGSPGTGRSARPRHGVRAAPPPCEASTCSTSSGSISSTPTLALPPSFRCLRVMPHSLGVAWELRAGDDAEPAEPGPSSADRVRCYGIGQRPSRRPRVPAERASSSCTALTL